MKNRESSENGYITMNAKNMHKSGDILLFDNATVYIQNPDFQLTKRVQAQTITLSDAGLSATSATSWDSNGVPTKSDWAIDTLLTPQTVLDRYLQPDQISFWDLPDLIRFFESTGFSAHSHRLHLQSLIASPFLLVTMILIAAVFSINPNQRQGGSLLRISLGIAIGFLLYFMTRITYALGFSTALPSAFAIWSPIVIFASLMTAILLHQEDG